MGPSAKVPVASEVAGELDQRYEQLRAIALGGQAGSNGLGLGVLAGRGMAAWITVWRSEPPPASWVPAALTADALVPAAGGSQLELVHVLAAMALAHLHL
jgi:hypothetical protein